MAAEHSTPRKSSRVYAPKNDLAGRQFGRWIAIHPTERRRKRKAYWLCRCKCGKIAEVWRSHLVDGTSKSCGCFARDAARNLALSRKTHGQSGTLTYRSWIKMIDRCANPENSAYGRYGGRGITVCERWANSFEAFLEDMGPRPSTDHSIDRINNEGNYEPGNTRWATQYVQDRNKSNNVWVTIGNKTLIVADWCRILGLSPMTYHARRNVGMSPHEALTRPVDPRASRARRHSSNARDA